LNSYFFFPVHLFLSKLFGFALSDSKPTVPLYEIIENILDHLKNPSIQIDSFLKLYLLITRLPAAPPIAPPKIVGSD